MYRLARGVLSIAAAVTLAGCEGMQALGRLQDGLGTEFRPADVNVNLYNGRVLTVTFWNSPFADLPNEQRLAVCRHAAEYVRDHYEGYERLESVGIAFATTQAAGPISMTHSETPCSFSRSDLRKPVAQTAGPNSQ